MSCGAYLYGLAKGRLQLGAKHGDPAEIALSVHVQAVLEKHLSERPSVRAQHQERDVNILDLVPTRNVLLDEPVGVPDLGPEMEAAGARLDREAEDRGGG
jgi:hypothetical protein